MFADSHDVIFLQAEQPDDEQDWVGRKYKKCDV